MFAKRMEIANLVKALTTCRFNDVINIRIISKIPSEMSSLPHLTGLSNIIKTTPT